MTTRSILDRDLHRTLVILGGRARLLELRKEAACIVAAYPELAEPPAISQAGKRQLSPAAIENIRRGVKKRQQKAGQAAQQKMDQRKAWTPERHAKFKATLAKKKKKKKKKLPAAARQAS